MIRVTSAISTLWTRKFRHSKSSVYRWYPQLHRHRFVYDTYRTMKATWSRHGWVHMFITHCPTVTLQLHNFDLLRLCRTSIVSALLRGNWQDFNWQDASRGPSAIAELLVKILSPAKWMIYLQWSDASQLKCLAILLVSLITIHISDCQFSDIHILQGSVAIYLKCGGIRKYEFAANLPLSLVYAWVVLCFHILINIHKFDVWFILLKYCFL